MKIAIAAALFLASAVCLAQPKPAPAVDVSAFDGVYSTRVPTTAKLACAGGKCDLKIASSAESYNQLNAVQPESFSQARFALNYAREHKANVKKDRAWLGTLLDSKADIESCIDLSSTRPGYDGRPGITLLCKLDQNPWRKPVVILMGSILAECAGALCRYSLVPLFKE